MRSVIAVLLGVAAVAHADDEAIRAGITREGVERVLPSPMLRFEPGFDLSIEASQHETFELDHLTLTGTWHAQPPERYGSADLVRWWRAAITGSWGPLSVTGSFNETDTVLGRGRYVDLAIALTKTAKLSKNVEGFISIGLEVRRWLGEPVPGERPSDGRVMLSAGVKWK